MKNIIPSVLSTAIPDRSLSLVANMQQGNENNSFLHQASRYDSVFPKVPIENNQGRRDLLTPRRPSFSSSVNKNGVRIEYNKPDSGLKVNVNANVFGVQNGRRSVLDANIEHKIGQANLNADLNSFNGSAKLLKDKTPIVNIEGDVNAYDLTKYGIRYLLPNDWYLGTPKKELNIKISKKH